MQIPVRLEALEDDGNWGNMEGMGERERDGFQPRSAHCIQLRIIFQLAFTSYKEILFVTAQLW